MGCLAKPFKCMFECHQTEDSNCCNSCYSFLHVRENMTGKWVLLYMSFILCCWSQYYLNTHTHVQAHTNRPTATGPQNKTDVGLMRVNDCWNRFSPIWNQINGPNLVLVGTLAGKWLLTPETLQHVKAQSRLAEKPIDLHFRWQDTNVKPQAEGKPGRVSFGLVWD